LFQFNLSRNAACFIHLLIGAVQAAVPFFHVLKPEERGAIEAFLALAHGTIGYQAYTLTPAGNPAENPPTKQQVEAQENAAAAKGKNLDGSDKY